MTSFYDTLKTYDWDDVKQNIMDKSKNDAIAAINNPHRTLDDFMALISPAATPLLEDMAVVDNDAIQFLAAHQVDKAFVSATGIRGTQGLTTPSLFQFAVKRQIIKSAQEVYALLVESKFHATGVNLFADFRELTGIVTSKPVTNPDLLERLEQEHVQVITTDR